MIEKLIVAVSFRALHFFFVCIFKKVHKKICIWGFLLVKMLTKK